MSCFTLSVRKIAASTKLLNERVNGVVFEGAIVGSSPLNQLLSVDAGIPRTILAASVAP